MEQKLEAYRRRKRKVAMINKVASYLYKVLPWSDSASERTSVKGEIPIQDDNIIRNELKEIKGKNVKKEKDEEHQEVEVEEEEEEENEEEVEPGSLAEQIFTYLLYFLLWATLYLIAIQLEFGAVYFIISSLYLIWVNTRTKPRKAGEMSAYSVFNPNCEAIDGTLKAEQFEREIRYGSASVH